MSTKVAVITPYRRQAEEYHREQFVLRAASNSTGGELTADHMATIRTVDSAQAAEWDVVILDLVSTSADRVADIDHVADDDRACVAFTRARKIFWVVSGSMDGRLSDRRQDETPAGTAHTTNIKKQTIAILAYKRIMFCRDMVHVVTVRMPPLPSVYDRANVLKAIPTSKSIPADLRDENDAEPDPTVASMSPEPSMITDIRRPLSSVVLMEE